MKKIIVSIALAASLLGAGAACTPDEEVKPAPKGQRSSEQPKKEAAPEEKDSTEKSQPKQPERVEREDLLSFTLDDRSVHGINDVWVTWTIVNHSAEKSNYEWSWEAIAPNGDRVANSTEYVTDVLPGQKTKGDSPTVLDDPDVKINITSFDRTAAP